MIEVEEFTVKLLTGVPPKNTPVTPEKFVPVTVTDVPPAQLPLVGLTAVTDGAEPVE